MEKYLRQNKAITLITLVITIVILLILAGITIAALGGENGLLARVTQAKQAQIESEMKEQLTLAIQDLQMEKLGGATLDDITQEWIDEKIQDYECTIQEDASINGKKVIMEKSGIVCKFIIDENLNITQIEQNGNGANLEYEVISRDGENVKIFITITDKENGIKQIEYPDGDIAYYNGEEKKEEVGIDYTVALGVEYKFKITSGNGQEKEETILINDYYHKITKNLGEGISIDNTAVKAAYNKPYQATLTVGDEYIIDTMTVTMAGENVTVDKTTGIINIEKVTGDIEITATAKKLEIQTTTPIVNTSTSATSSLGASTQAIGITLYINFKATSNLGTCTIEPAVPYSVVSNGKYKFIVTVTYQNKTITKEIEVIVDQYTAQGGFVEYDAGDWTEEEISSLKNSKLYDLNASYAKNSTYKLNDDSGLNFTFGGFTYEGDMENESSISSGTIITSRNQSVSNEWGGIPKYNGWKILKTETKTDESGNTIKNEDGTERTYVAKLVHAGTPENFVYYDAEGDNNSYRAEYLLTGSANYGDTYKTLNNGTAINPRNWDMYKDKELDSKGYIKEVHAMARSEVIATSYNISTTGVYYWLASADIDRYLWYVTYNGEAGFSNFNHCLGIRPVVELNDGVYIASGDGTEASPYILAKE